MKTINTDNKFLVGVNFKRVSLVCIGLPQPQLTADDALLLAAYLVLLAEPHASFKFEEVLEAVQSI